jgi:hypothetical protein
MKRDGDNDVARHGSGRIVSCRVMPERGGRVGAYGGSMKHVKSRSLLAVGALALGAVGVSGVATAAGHSGTIHGCVNKSSGALRVVTHPSACSHGETALSFNTRGPRGLRGPRGARGPSGATAPTRAFQMYANVDAEGDLGSNVGAVSASRISTGEYSVVFNRPIGSCAAIAQAGEAGGTDPIYPVPSAVSFDHSNADGWDLQFVDSPTRTAINTPFMLTVTCGS